ncbi:hypothetical protein Ndes2526B_g03922 [Nannochloris sp. 'desiccata']
MNTKKNQIDQANFVAEASSFPHEELTLDEIQALESLGADSLRPEEPLLNCQTSSSVKSRGPTELAALLAMASHGPMLGSLAEGPSAPQIAKQSSVNPPIKSCSVAAGNSSFAKGAEVKEEPMKEEETNTTTSADEKTTQPQSSRTQRSSNLSAEDKAAAKREAQRLYRARSREKARNAREQLETALGEAQAEMEALRKEQENLRSEHTVLQAMREYKDSLIASARSALGNFTATSSVIYSFFGELQTVVWKNLITASEDQIDIISRSDSTLRAANRVFLNLLSSTVLEWGSASPEKRHGIERKLGLILSVRHRAVNSTWQKYPLRVARKLQYPPVDEDCLVKFANAKSCIAGQELLAAAALTDDQKLALMKHWELYLDRHNNLKSAAREGAESLEKSIATTQSGARPGDPVGSLSSGAQGFQKAAESVAALEKLSNTELLAQAQLILGAWSVLRPLQQAILMFDVTPQIDIVTIYKKLLSLEQGECVQGRGRYINESKNTVSATLCQC